MEDEEFIGFLEECYISGKDAIISFPTGEIITIEHNAIPDIRAMYVQDMQETQKIE